MGQPRRYAGDPLKRRAIQIELPIDIWWWIFGFAFVTTLLAAGPAEPAELTTEAQRLCKTTYAASAKSQARCVRMQIDAAGRVGRKLEEHAGDAEVQRVLGRCSAYAEANSDNRDWRRLEACFQAELAAYGQFNQVGANVADKFTTKIKALCRSKAGSKGGTNRWRNTEHCRKMQTKSGHAVARLYRGETSGSIAQKVMNSCAAEHRGKGDSYDWVAIKFCIENFRRR